jgi:hypothetical protein
MRNGIGIRWQLLSGKRIIAGACSTGFKLPKDDAGPAASQTNATRLKRHRRRADFDFI